VNTRTDFEGKPAIALNCKEWPFREPWIFDAPPGFPNGYWVVYAERQDLALTSSTIAVVSKKYGRVVLVGSARDEG
jgi:hypothetical protein